MKIRDLALRLLKVSGAAILTLILLVSGVVVALYSPWMQRRLVSALNGADLGDLGIRVESLCLRPPVRLEASGLKVILAGDTMLDASHIDLRVKPLPLLFGRVEFSPARLADARLKIGGPDSSLYMRIQADTIDLRPASITIPGLGIDIRGGSIRGASIALLLNPSDTPSDSSSTPDMKIRIHRLDLERFGYTMRMMPTIDSLGSYIARGTLRDGRIDLGRQEISLKSFLGTGLDVTYIAPAADEIPAADLPADNAPADISSEPWTIRIDTIGFDASTALYATRGIRPAPGLDFGYIQASDMSLGVHDFYNRMTDVVLPVRLTARERCGVLLDASGTVRVSASDLRLDSFAVSLPDYGTTLYADFMMGMGDMLSDPSLPISLYTDGSVAAGALRDMFPIAGSFLTGMPDRNPIEIQSDIHGTMGLLDISRLKVRINHLATLSAHGRVANATDLKNIDGTLTLDGSISNGAVLYRALAASATGTTVDIPPMVLDGRVDMHRGQIDGTLQARTLGGELGMDAGWNSRHEDYRLALTTSDFPLQAILPDLELANLSARVDASGHGYNPADSTMQAEAHIALDAATFRGANYRDINVDAAIHACKASITVESSMPDANFTLDAEGNLNGPEYTWTAALDGENINLQNLRLTDSPCTLQGALDASATVRPEPSLLSNISARLTLHSLDYIGTSSFSIDGVTARLDADTAVTNLSVNNRNFYTFFSSECGIDTLLSRFDVAAGLLSEQIAQRNIKVDTLRRSLPQFVLDVNAGDDNVLTDILAARDMAFRRFTVEAANDSLLSLDAKMLRFRTGTTYLDTITFSANQRRDNLVFAGAIGNRPGTLDEWAHVGLKGFLRTDHVGIRVSQSNIQGQHGYDIGLRAGLADSTVTVNLFPYTPLIGYKQWTINSDNFLSYNIGNEHLDANIHMSGDDSSLAIYTEHREDFHGQEDLVVRLSDIHLQDWIAINPFAPPISGDIGANLNISRDGEAFIGNGSLQVDRLNYGRKPVGTFRADFDVAADIAGHLNAKADLFVDSLKTVTLAGAINPEPADSTNISPLQLDMELIHFPLAVANPFLPNGMARLSGTLNGTMDVTGRIDEPRLNGWLRFDSTAVNLGLTGTDYKFSPVRIPVDDNVVKFNNFAVYGTNDNPLTMNGTVDLRRFINPQFDLALKAKNMQIVNTQRARRGADVYGKAFIDLNATARGNLRTMMVNAQLALLSGTNVTYVMPDAVNAITQHSTDDMVKFVNLTDSAEVAAADSIANNAMLLFVNAMVDLQPGSTVSVDLSSDGKNKAQIQPNGSLNFTMSPVTSEGRLSGRINIDKGFVRYTMPPLSEKLFNFLPDSYVSFNGNIMNPTLNVFAYDDVKANVTQTGQNSRLVDFDVKLGVTGTLENMKIDFDLAAENDITVANELQSMSADQRASQAMNLLLYGVYTGPNTTGNAAIGGNMLFSFLESQLNSWAANTLHGIDLSFGINQYDRTYEGQTSLTTTYSYQVSKSLFDDRFKIVIGGNYSTDANADENFSQNLINDISFEYFLNKQHTMYLRLFRHTGYESILEGEVTQMGVGFVYKKRLRRLIDLFIPAKTAQRIERAAKAKEENSQTQTPAEP